MAAETLSAEDVEHVAEVFLQTTVLEVRRARSGWDWYTPSTSPAYATLSYINDIISKQEKSSKSVITGGDFCRVLCDRLLESNDVFSFLWSWMRTAIEECLLAPLATPDSRTSELLVMIDRLYWVLISRAKDLKEIFDRGEEILATFTRMWLTDCERGHSTQTIPVMIVLQLFTPEQFSSAVGGGIRDVAEISLTHVELAARHFLNGRSRWQLRWVIELVYDLSASCDRFEICVTSCGLIPRFLEITKELVAECIRKSHHDERDKSEEEPYGIRESIFVATKLLMLIAAEIDHGPLHLNYALDAGILSVILSTGVLWKRPQKGGTERRKLLDRLGETLIHILTAVQRHVFHLRALRHIVNAIASFPGEQPETPSSCPFSQTWADVYRRIIQAGKFREAFKANPVGRMRPCDNPHCFRQGSDIRDRIQLKQCSQCLSQRVCSLHCQRETWKVHREHCNHVANVRIEYSVHPPFLMSSDVTEFYQSAVQYYASRSASQLVRQYEKYRGRLHFQPPDRLPLYAINVDLDSFPPKFRSVKLEACTGGDITKYFWGLCQSRIRQSEYSQDFILYSDFVVGKRAIRVFSMIRRPYQCR